MLLENTDINGPTVLLMDWHGEYTGGLDQVKGYEDGKYCEALTDAIANELKGWTEKEIES